MFVYHTTTKEASESILASEFRSCEEVWVSDRLWRGVWFADHPVDGHAGSKGNTVLVIEIPEEVFDRYSRRQEGRVHQESLIPSEIINRYGPPRICQGDELNQARENECKTIGRAVVVADPEATNTR